MRTQRFFIEAANPTPEEGRALLQAIRTLCAEGPQARSDDDWAQVSGLKNGMLARTAMGVLERAGFVRRAPAAGASGRSAWATELLPDPGEEAFDRAFAGRGEKPRATELGMK